MKTILRKEVARVGLIGIGFLILFLAASCADGYVTQNGFLEKGHKELKESLVGDWRVIDKDLKIPGSIVYEFFKGDKGKLKLKINGEEASIERFDSVDGLSFTFHFTDGAKNSNYVYGQFKSYAKKELIVYQGSNSNSKQLSHIEASATEIKDFKTLNKVIVASNENN